MSMTGFNANQYDPATGANAFPVGNHGVVIRSGATVPVKDKPQEGMLVLTCEIIDGANKGSRGDYRLNLWNSNAQASEIAHKQLSALCHVTGRMQLQSVNNPVELFGVPFRIIVEPQADPKYTQVSAVLDAAGNPPVKGQPYNGAQQPAQSGPGAAPAGGAAGGAPPWQPPQPPPQPPTQFAGPQQSVQQQQPPAQAQAGGTPPWAAQQPSVNPPWA